MGSVEVKITYSDKEIKKAISFYIMRIQNIKTYALIVYPIICVAILLPIIFNDYVLLSIIFAFCGFMLYYIYYSRPIEGYLQFYRKRKGGLYKFENDKVTTIGEEVKSEFLWAVFKKAYETPTAFLLLDENRFIYVFPKACFTDTQAIEQLQELLKAKIPTFKSYT